MTSFGKFLCFLFKKKHSLIIFYLESVGFATCLSRMTSNVIMIRPKPYRPQPGEGIVASHSPISFRNVVPVEEKEVQTESPVLTRPSALTRVRRVRRLPLRSTDSSISSKWTCCERFSQCGPFGCMIGCFPHNHTIAVSRSVPVPDIVPRPSCIRTSDANPSQPKHTVLFV